MLLIIVAIRDCWATWGAKVGDLATSDPTLALTDGWSAATPITR
jgi:hypothetical protein